MFHQIVKIRRAERLRTPSRITRHISVMRTLNKFRPWLFCLALSVVASLVGADTIQLKTGRMVDGTVISQTPNQLTIRTGDSNITLRMELVERITRDADEPQSEEGREAIGSLSKLVIQGRLKQYQARLGVVDRSKLSSAQQRQFDRLKQQALAQGKENDEIERQVMAKATDLVDFMKVTEAITHLENSIRQYPFLHEPRRKLLDLYKCANLPDRQLLAISGLVSAYPEEEYDANAGTIYTLCVSEGLKRLDQVSDRDTRKQKAETYIRLAAATRGFFRGGKLSPAEWATQWQPIFERMREDVQRGNINTQDPNYLLLSALSLDLLVEEGKKRIKFYDLYDALLARDVEVTYKTARVYDQQHRDRVVCLALAQQYKQLQDRLNERNYSEALKNLMKIRALVGQINHASFATDPFTGVTIVSRADSDAFMKGSEPEKINKSIPLLESLPISGSDVLWFYANNHVLEMSPSNETVRSALAAKVTPWIKRIEEKMLSGMDPRLLVKDVQDLKQFAPEAFKIEQVKQQVNALESHLKIESEASAAYAQLEKKYNGCSALDDYQQLKAELAAAEPKYEQTMQKPRLRKLISLVDREVSHIEEAQRLASMQAEAARQAEEQRQAMLARVRQIASVEIPTVIECFMKANANNDSGSEFWDPNSIALVTSFYNVNSFRIKEQFTLSELRNGDLRAMVDVLIDGNTKGGFAFRKWYNFFMSPYNGHWRIRMIGGE